jgi:ParB-like nuclease domain
MSNVVPIKMKLAPSAKRSRMDTLVITADTLKSWSAPNFQRPLRENEKIRALCNELKNNGGVVPGIITIGNISDDKRTYIIDGQHRLHAFSMSELKECYADVRIIEFDSLDEMGKEFVKLNSSLVRMRPDDVLRGLEPSNQSLQLIRHLCPFVGYDNIRRSIQYQPMIGMATALRVWAAGTRDAPTATGNSAFEMAQGITVAEARMLSDFLNICFQAFGRDKENGRAWTTLNLALWAWIYRRMVLNLYAAPAKKGMRKATTMTSQEFRKCLMAACSNRQYMDWLWGRTLTERDRSPAYRHIRKIIAARLKEEGKEPKLPQPVWANF